MFMWARRRPRSRLRAPRMWLLFIPCDYNTMAVFLCTYFSHMMLIQLSKTTPTELICVVLTRAIDLTQRSRPHKVLQFKA